MECRRKNIIHFATTTDPDRPRRWKTREEVLARIRELEALPPLRTQTTAFTYKHKPHSLWSNHGFLTREGMRKKRVQKRLDRFMQMLPRTGT